ncbi:MAG: IPT/TIG domain-containing protein [Methylococcaceae bacterium]
MMEFKKTAMVALLAGLGFTEVSQAELSARGSDMVYDDVNDITWAADANLFQTQAAADGALVSKIIAANSVVIDGVSYSGVIQDTANTYDDPNNPGIHTLTAADFDTSTGMMTWFGAQAWINSLNVGGYSGWRLSTTPTEDTGYVNTSELGGLFYDQLGGTQQEAITDFHNSNYAMFTNVQADQYVGSESSNPDMALVFNTNVGKQYTQTKYSLAFYAWVVHAGDVASTPTVSVISPASGVTAGGATVTLTGTNFTGATAVSIGGIAATNITYISSTSLTATTPAHVAGTASVSVGTNAANSLFTYYATPTVSAISPAYGVTAGGTVVTLTGTSFTGATAVSMGGISATNVTVLSDTSLTATTPAHFAGAASVSVTSPGGANEANSFFNYTNGGPGVTLTTGTAGVGALWQMLALPCVPATGTGTIAGVLGTGTSSNLSTANYASSSLLLGWIIEDRTVGAVPAYRALLTSNLPLSVGTGYWLKSYQAPTNGKLTMECTTTPTDVTQAQGCYSANGCKAITVTTYKAGANRYNLVGNPFAYPIDWSTVRIRVDGLASTLTPSAAYSAGYIDNTVNIWNGTTYDAFTDVAPYPSTPNLQYFKSFWINVLPGAFGHTIELLIPAEQSTLSRNQALPANREQLATVAMPWYLGWLDWVVSPAAAAPTPAVSNHVNPQILANPADWYIRLKVNNLVTGWKDRGALLGQLSDAKTGFDAHDVAKMAPFSTPYLTLVFPHPEWGTKAADYASDFHPVDLNAHSWSFEVRANPVGSKVFLSWEGSPALLKRSRLIDVATGKIILPTDPLWAMKGYPITLKSAVQSYIWKVLAP